MTWEQGYVVDTPYTYGYYSEMAPQRIEYGLLLSGHEPLPPGPCCELGFGQGVTLNLNAAADPARQWWGNDFNPTQTRFARDLTAAAGTRAILSDESFIDFCSRDDLPEFSVIAMHGVWSWISRENQRAIIDLVRRKLSIGGVLHVSYNTPHGWAAMAPVRHLFAEHANATGLRSTNSAEKMQRAIEFVGKILATNPRYLAMNPSVKGKLEAMSAHAVAYLPHEYLNADWTLTTFAEMSRALEEVKLTYAGNGSLLDRIDVLHVDDAQRKLLTEIPDAVLRETTREFMTDTMFRRDYWVKGPARGSVRRRIAAIQDQAYVLAALPDKVPKDVQCARGKWDLNPEIYRPLVSVLSAQRDPLTRGELGDRMEREHKIGQGQLSQALAILVAIGAVHPVQPESVRRRAEPTCADLNARILQTSIEEYRVAHLVSPVSGLGVAVDFGTQMILGAKRSGLSSPEAIARFAHDAMSAQGLPLRVGGHAVEDPAGAIEKLTVMAANFERIVAPVFQRLAIA